MKASSTLVILLLVFVALVAAWAKEDHEIFRLRDEVLEAEGSDVTFYSFLGVKPSATLDEINKAFRKKSRQLHPDKAIQQLIAERSSPKPSAKGKPGEKKKPGVTVTKGPTQKERTQIAKEANERYARLGVVASIVRGASRERYDHFLQNGFPKWRGTGYYYERFRPGLGSVLVGLLVTIGGGVHYFTLYMNYKRQREFVERYISHARRTAWGNNGGIPGIADVGTSYTAPPAPVASAPGTDAEQEQQMPMNRKQKRFQEQQSRKKDVSKATRASRIHGTRDMDSSDAGTPPVQAEPVVGTAQGNKKRVVAENGKVLVVDQSGNVFLEEETEEGEKHEYLLDPEEIPMPTIYNTALCRLPVWLYSQSVGRLMDKNKTLEPFLDGDISVLNSTEEQSEEAIASATEVNSNDEKKRRRNKVRS